MLKSLRRLLTGSGENLFPMAEKLVEDLIASKAVVVFSKSYCPFCTKAKKALDGAGVKGNYEVIELEDRDDCDAIQVCPIE